jgi:hypothetical protein
MGSTGTVSLPCFQHKFKPQNRAQIKNTAVEDKGLEAVEQDKRMALQLISRDKTKT